MFDIGFWELAIIGVIALLIIGPERLPKAARTAGFWVGRARRLVSDLKADIDKEIRDSEIDELKEAGEALNEVRSDIEKESETFTARIVDEEYDSFGDPLSHRDDAEPGKTTPSSPPTEDQNGNLADSAQSRHSGDPSND